MFGSLNLRPSNWREIAELLVRMKLDLLGCVRRTRKVVVMMSLVRHVEESKACMKVGHMKG